MAEVGLVQTKDRQNRSQHRMTEAKTDEETYFFRLIGEEMNDTKLEEVLANSSEEKRNHLFGLVNYSGIFVMFLD